MLRFALLMVIPLAGCSKKDAVCGNGTVVKNGKCVSMEVPNRQTNESEAAAVLAEFRIRQEQYHLENGEYLSTGEEDDFFPRIQGDSGSIATPPETWRRLRLAGPVQSRATLRCGYSSFAGTPEEALSIGRIGLAFNFKPPNEANWFYLVARCPGTKMYYFSSMHGHGVASKPFSEID